MKYLVKIFSGLTVLLVAAALTGWSPGASASATLKQSPMLDAMVKAGKIPPLTERVPSEYQKIDFKSAKKKTGKYGGKLRLLMGKQKDTRMVTVYGYARLVTFTPELEIEPNLLRAVDVEENKVFTFHIRKGHKWSDGHPFTAEDFRYYWEDVANNSTLSPGGPPRTMTVDGNPAKFEVIDKHTVRYSWDKPNNDFLIWLAGSRPAAIFRPAHYLKQFHMDHGNAEKIAAIVKDKGYKNWAKIHFRKDRYYRADNPEQPTLQPWINTTKPPADRFVFKRNPYYHRIDDQGQQLPYIDEIVVQLGTTSMIPARTGSGESDLQGRYLSLKDYTFLKKSGKQNKV
ncbi:MAG: ABC transporter substrate-binding protein, partial [Methyloligellaceae bacterium]